MAPSLDDFKQVGDDEGHLAKSGVVLDEEWWEFIKEQMRNGHRVYYQRAPEGPESYKFAEDVTLHVEIGEGDRA